jgi:hypothetical protein
MENYGHGRSTGLDQTALGKIETGFEAADVFVTDADRGILRHLAEEVAEIAASSEMEQIRRLWKQINALEKTRPAVFCDPENGWNEIITEAQMECRSRLARSWEMDLRKEIFWGRVMGDDKPVEPYFDVPYTVAPDDWGMQAVYHRTDESGSYVWDNPIKDYRTDLKRLRSPVPEIDWDTTLGCLEVAKDLFGDLLTVRLKGTWWWSLGLTLPAAVLRGLTNMLLDFLDHPDELRELLSLISRGYMDKLDYLEEHDLLSLNNDGTYVGSGGFGFTDELPQGDYVGHVRCADMWGFGESQETVHVSPEMYEEVIFPYEAPILDRFGLTCYGCCEPLHRRWSTVGRHHNLRRVSCSPWVDLEYMAENLRDRHILSIKPNPAAISRSQVDWDSMRKGFRELFAKTRGCVVEVIMKDNHTIGGRPENVVEWCSIAREEAQRAGERS